LTSGGILLLILLTPTIDYPLFSKALRKYEEVQPNYNNIVFVTQLKNAHKEVLVYEKIVDFDYKCFSLLLFCSSRQRI